MRRGSLAWASFAVFLAVGPGCGDDDRRGIDGGLPRPDAGGVPPGDAGPLFDGGPGRDGGPGGADAGTSGYTETVCSDPLADLTDVASAYPGSGLRAATRAIAERRYPIAVAFIDGQTDMQLMTWFRSTAAFSNVLEGFETAAHEGAHIWDYDNTTFSMHSYRMREDLTIVTRALDNYARSEILTRHAFAASDFYADTYLSGFSGTQGFNNLLDEYNAYTHSLAAKYCTRDSLRSGTRTSARDGILTFMYYVELYLKGARLDHPDDYAEIVGDPEHIRFILTNWDRAEFYLDLTSTRPELGINDATIRTSVYQADNLAEIEMLRAMR